MLKVDAITFFGSKTKLANAAGVRLASVAAWGILVPEGRAMRLFERWKAIDTRDKREKFTALVPAIMEATGYSPLNRRVRTGKTPAKNSRGQR